MKKGQISKLKSLMAFKMRIEETHTLIRALDAHIIIVKEFLESTNARERSGYGKFRELVEVDERQVARLYELGFIALFADFECFMFEFLKDLFEKYPRSFQSDRAMKFDNIKDFKSIKEIREYFVESSAIEKSYDIEAWTTFLNQRFGITIFRRKAVLLRFKALNSLRNLVLHSGSKTNAKFRNEMRLFLNTPVPIGKPIKLDRKKFFSILYNILQLLIRNIEQS